MTIVPSFIRRHPYRAATALLTIVVAAALWVRLGPIAPQLLDVSHTTSTVVVDRHGVPLYEALSGDGTRSIRLEADLLPPMLAAATVAAEDRRFYSHPGIDPLAIVRALKRNIVERGVVEGGSTITQQTAKLLLSRREPARSRGVAAKIQEAVLAQRLEHRFSKRQILALYLNLAAYGNQIVGAGRASFAYFGHDPSMLTPAQAAFLAGLPQRPSGFNPYRNPTSALARQRAVLRRMESAGVITSAQAREAADERLTFTKADAPFAARHFVERVLTSSGGREARIETTLDAGLQAEVAGIIRSHRAVLDRHGANNVAVVVLQNDTGEWLAWEGSGDYFDTAHGGAIDGVISARQPGSALKPFTYALGFEEGLTPATVLADIPSHFPTAQDGVLYSPRNYDGRYRGPLLARRALAGSENVPAVALASQLGVPNVLRFLMRAGFSTFDRNASYYGLGITLGNAEVRLDELVAAYAAFARGGEWIEPTWKRGQAAAGRERHQLVSARTAYWIGDILSDPDAREYIFGRGGNLEFPFPVAVKTGTSQAYHDNWTVGYTRSVTVGVWVGNFDRTPLRDSTGVTGAGPIFHAVMLAAERRAGPSGDTFADAAIAPPPDGLVERDICVLSGMPANPWCPSKQREHVAAGEDAAPCSWHHQSDNGLLTIWPAEYREWARRNGLLTEPAAAASAIVVREVRGSVATRAPLTISSPPTGATYLIDPTLRREFQTLPLRAVTDRPGRLEWRVNDRPLGSSTSRSALEWPLVPGTHLIAVKDQQGRVRRDARGGAIAEAMAMPQPVRTFGLTHMALTVGDPRRSQQFYRSVVGARTVYESDDFVQVQTPGSRDVLVFERGSAPAASSSSGGHFGFRLRRPEDLAVAIAAIQAAGGELLDQGEFVPGEPYVFFTDPDGYKVEIWYELPTRFDPGRHRNGASMIDEQLQRSWHFKQLKWSLQSLVQAGSAQPTLFPEQAPKPDDLAFAFDHWSADVCDAYGTELSAAQESALAAIAAKLATMSSDGAEFDVDLWTEAALTSSEHWAEVRTLAQSALAAFEWTIDLPPDEPEHRGPDDAEPA